MRVILPAQLPVVCPQCEARFSVQSRDLLGHPRLACPYCRQEFEVYYGLRGQARRRLYHALRDFLEHAVYAEYRRQRADYSDEWSTPES